MLHRTWTRPIALLASGLLVFGLAACGDDDDAADDPVVADDGAGTVDEGDDAADAGDDMADGAGASVTAQDFSFSVSGPAAAGATVAFENTGAAPHTLTADDDSFASDRVEGGASGSITAPSEAGDYAFHCEIHPQMTGTLTVEA